MKKKRLYMLIAVVGLLLMWSYCGTTAETTDGQGLQHLHDRPWVSSLPKDPRAPSHALVFLKRDSIGASINGSAYQHLVTILRHKAQGKKLTVEVLQAGKKFTTLARTYECKGPGDLDLCLELGPRVKQIRLYSSSRWHIGEAGTPNFGTDTIVSPSISSDDLVEIEPSAGVDLLMD